MLVFEERGKPEYPGKNLSQQRRGQTTNSTNILRRRRDLNSGHIGGRRALSPLRHLGPPQLFAQIISYLSRQIVENCVQSLYINLTPLSMYQIKGKYIKNNHYVRDTELGFSFFWSFNCIFLHFRRLVWRSVSSLSPPQMMFSSASNSTSCPGRLPWQTKP